MEPTADYYRRSTRLPLIYWLRHCAICTHRLRRGAVLLEESDTAPEPRQSWLLCLECESDVRHEIERAALRSAQRLRIAIGVVASDRGHAVPKLSREDLEEKWVERGLIGMFWLVFSVHALAFLIVVVHLMAMSH